MRVLALDIETSPMVAYTWGIWEQNVSLDQIVDTGGVLCFAAKWLDGKRMMFHRAQPDDDGILSDKAEMLAAAHALLDEADAVLHYNGARFDIPHLNREFVEAGMMPPSPFVEIDLFQTVKRKFKFQSNKLQHISKQLGLPGKIENGGFLLWPACMAGDAKAWKMMERYNRQDVKLLEELYEILLPWIPNHPNRALHDGRSDACPRCGSDRLQRRGTRRTQTGVYPQWQCLGCGGYSRGRRSESGVQRVSV